MLYMQKKQQEDWENDWVNSICVMPNKTVLKGGFSGMSYWNEDNGKNIL